MGIALMLSVAAAVAGAGWGCAAPASFESPDPTSRLTALGQAVEQDDRSAIPGMISMLDSDDPAVRLFAILALEEMTGETLGYDHAAPELERRAAADRWQAWYLRQEGTATVAQRERGRRSSGRPRSGERGRRGGHGGRGDERGGAGGPSFNP